METITYLVANYNNGRYLRACLDSLVQQTDPTWICLVVDDASSDDSLETIEPYVGERIALIRNDRNLGYTGSLKVLIERATTDIVAILDADDALYPDANACLRATIHENPGAGLVYSKLAVFDETLTECQRIEGSAVPSGKTSLEGGFIGHIRAFRRSVYFQTGGLDESILYAEDRDMVYKLEEVTRPVFIDRVLYKWRTVPSSQSRDPIKKAIGLRNHLRAQEDALARRGIVGFEAYCYRLFFLAHFLLLCDRSPGLVRSMIWRSMRALRVVDEHLGLRSGGMLRRFAGRRVAYYLWHYPVLSQTFIQREIAALKQAGLDLTVIADTPDESADFDEAAQRLASGTDYLFPLRVGRMLRALARHLIRSPRGLWEQFLYVASHRYQQTQNPREDLAIFLKALYLAATLEDRGIEHAHAPWADVNSFVLLVAARLANIPYSIEARAHEVHRKEAMHGLPEKLGNAAFVITNCQFNAQHIRSFLPPPNAPPVHVLYEGLPVAQFQPHPARKLEVGLLQILSVARLIEPKGLEYLLLACKTLKDRGYRFHCEIIGGPEEPRYADYHAYLLALHRQLGLTKEVNFLGPRPFADVLSAYASATIFVLPCVTAQDGTQDITPNSILEAMAMQLPVVSTLQTAIPELIEPGLEGILVPPRDAHTLAEALIKLADDAALRQRLGEGARRKIERRFDISNNILPLLQLFSGSRPG